MNEMKRSEMNERMGKRKRTVHSGIVCMKILSHPGFMWQQLTDKLYHIK